ncbi:MAG: tetratricopeptide repeat-containing diguanylate cyclase [Ilumatobacter fluminis]|uniref:Diguanylate cyclase (GGDEF)-like protein n=1 Tax=Ilumatobacter fluminis TaxID=467091 RepID=A0A4R7HZM8_9ACTN|nr:diguanylate cyclase [Ilumatobacter fluminis]TDT16300.1 diguanylate cyclase (GGDEF)-like protein [Ilumatobacter fluminis]
MSSVSAQQREIIERLTAAADPATKRDASEAEQASRELIAIAEDAHDDELALVAHVWLCINLHQRGKLHQAISLAQVLRPQLTDERPGTRLGDLRLELLRTTALAASEAGEFDIGIDAAEELANDPDVHTRADAAFDAAFSLAICLERMGNSWQALRVLNDVMARHGDGPPSFGMLYTLNGIVATAIGAFHRVRDLDDGEAVDLLITARDAAERAVPMLDQFANQLYRAALTGNLGEILIYQGELDAADHHLRGALAWAEEIDATAHRDRIRASIGAWLLASGQADEALEWLEQLVDDLDEDGTHSTRVRAHHTAHLAARELGWYDRALDHLTEYERLERQRTTSQLRSASELFVTRTEAEAEAERHRYSAERDPLTGLANRRRLNRVLAELNAAADEPAPYALAMVDVDHFKSVNDELGHAVGDSVLVELAQILLDGVGDDDVVVRYGGEEIVIVFPGAGADTAAFRCERLRSVIEQHVWADLPAGRRLTVSMGIASTPHTGPERVVGAADRAMYAAKRGGRNQVRVATDDDARDATPTSIPRR